LEREILNEMRERIVNSFMDIVVLANLKNGSMSGYDVVTFIHDEFHILFSSGTVYSLLYSLERNGLIIGRWSQRKRVYTLTDKGEKKIKAILEAKQKILDLIMSLFM